MKFSGGSPSLASWNKSARQKCSSPVPIRSQNFFRSKKRQIDIFVFRFTLTGIGFNRPSVSRLTRLRRASQPS